MDEIKFPVFALIQTPALRNDTDATHARHSNATETERDETKKKKNTPP